MGFETRSHMSAIPPIRLLRGMQMIWRTGNCGTANLSFSDSTLSSLSSGLQDLEVKKNSMDEANEAVAFG